MQLWTTSAAFNFTACVLGEDGDGGGGGSGVAAATAVVLRRCSICGGAWPEGAPTVGRPLLQVVSRGARN